MKILLVSADEKSWFKKRDINFLNHLNEQYHFDYLFSGDIPYGAGAKTIQWGYELGIPIKMFRPRWKINGGAAVRVMFQEIVEAASVISKDPLSEVVCIAFKGGKNSKHFESLLTKAGFNLLRPRLLKEI